MKMLLQKVLLFCTLCCLLALSVAAQHGVDFTIPNVGCLNQNIYLENLSDESVRYEWDLCQGDLSLSPSASGLGSIGGSVTTGIDIVFDGTNWFGFVTSQNTNAILRLDFGTDIYSLPSIVNLGNISGQINSPTDIKIITENGHWYGFVYGLNEPLLSRIDFGTSLTNTMSSSTPIMAEPIIPGAGTVNGGFDMLYDGTYWNVIYTVNTSINIARLPTVNLGPTASDLISNVSNPFATALGDVIIVKTGSNYFGYVVDFGGKSLQRLSFGSTLFGTPTIDNIPLSLLAGFSPYGIDMGYDNGRYYLFVSTLEGSLLRVSLGSDLSMIMATGANLGNLSSLENTLKIKLIKNQSRWMAFSPSWISNRLYRIDFQNAACESSFTNVLTDIEPMILFSTSGQKAITLRAYKNGGEYSDLSKSIAVTDNTAPPIDFGYENICVSSVTEFKSVSSDPIQLYSWDFGDLTISADPIPVHQYTAAGEYEVNLTVTAPNGCENSSVQVLKIYDEPSASFTLPSGLICTNNEFSFTNTTPDGFDGNLSYKWMVDELLVSTSRNMSHTFLLEGDKQIKLIVSIPGCSDEAVQTMESILVGPAVGFTREGTCVGETISFTNTSSGEIVGYQWDFGNGRTSTNINESEVYSNIGGYMVTLEAISNNGCVSTASELIQIYSIPQPNFSIDLPPFSCVGSPSQFNDLTPPLSDSNITTWTWGFGDAANGSSTQKNPTYTYSLAGDYQVSLSTTTNFGCTASIQKQVTISTAPAVDFTNAVACLNQGTQFTDASDPTAKAWLWSIQNSTYTTKDPTHVFSATGSQPVMLTVTGNNNCVSQITKTVSVPIPAVPDFTAISTCAGKPTVFQEKNPGGNDPAVSWSWDFGGQGTGTGSPTEHTFLDVDSYTVKMNSTRQSGCVYSVTKSVSISQSPHAQFSPSPETGGSPLTVGFTNTSSLATSYLWKFKDADNSTSTEFSPSFIFNQLGEYPVELIASNALGCQDSFTKMIQVVVPNVNAVLSEFKLTPSGSSMKATVTIKNQGNISMSNPEVIIDLSGNASVKEKLVGTIPPNQSLTRTLSLDILLKNLKYACAELNTVGDTYLFDNRQCINLEPETIAIQPYPNPAQDELFIDWINPGSESMHVVIYNAAGQIVFDKKYEPLLVGLNQIKLNVSNLGAGIYFVSYLDGNISRTSRFSIVR